MKSQKGSVAFEIPQIPLFNNSSMFSTRQSISPRKNRETSIFGPKKDSLISSTGEEDEERVRASSFKKSYRNTKGSILFFQGKRSTISMNSRASCFLDEESKAKKNILSSLDIYTEEQLMGIAVKILQKPKNQRSYTDVKILMRCTEKVAFFAEMINNQEAEKHEECCRAMGYKYGQKGEIIVKEGSLGQNFYVILQGTMGVYKMDLSNGYNSLSSINDNENTSKLFKKTSLMLKNNVSKTMRRLSSRAQQKESPQEITSNNEISNEIKVKVLKGGESFGELSLLDNRPRAASVICEQECHLAVLEKQYFDKILKDLEKKKLYKQIEFFASIKLFSSWSYNAIKNLYYLSSSMDFKKSATVYMENDPPGDVYIIKSGEFKVIRSKEQKNQKSNELRVKASPKKTKNIEICTLGPGESFGEEEIIEKVPRKNTVICNSITAAVFVIDQKEFLKRVFASQNTKKQLQKQIYSKSKWRDQRVEDQYFNEDQNNFNEIFRKKGEFYNEIKKDPEEFAMIRGPSSKKHIKNLSNKKQTYINPLKILEKQQQPKGKMIPVMENIIDPMNFISSLQGCKSLLKNMTSNSPKTNFFMLNNLLNQEKKKKLRTEQNFNEEKKQNIKLIHHNDAKFSHKNESEIYENKPTKESDRVPSTSNSSRQIILPFSMKSVNNYLKIRVNSLEDEYQLPNMNTLTKRNFDKKRKNTKTKFKTMTFFDDIFIEGRNSGENLKPTNTSRRKNSWDVSNQLYSFLPLKYSSENIKKIAHISSLSASHLTRKPSNIENYDNFLTPRNK